MDFNKSERSWIRDFEDDLLGTTMKNNFGPGRSLEGNKYLQKAAKI